VLEIDTRVAVDETYDSNVLSRTDNTVDDFYTSIRPRATLRYETERTRVEASGALDSRMYSDLSDLNAVNREFEYDSSFLLTPRLSAFSGGEYRFLEDTDETEEDGVTLTLGRPDFESISGFGGARYALSSRSGLTFSGSFAEFEFGSGDITRSQQRDSNRSSYGGAFDRRISARDRLRLSVTRGNSEFDSTIASPSSESRSTAVDLSWGRTWSSRWSSNFSGGFQYLESDVVNAAIIPVNPGDLPDNQPDDTTTSFVGSANLERRSKRSSLDFSYSREIRPSSGFGTDLAIDSLGVSFERRLNRRWTLRLSGNWSRLSSATEQVFTIPVPETLLGFCSTLFTGTVPAHRAGFPVCAGVSDNAIDSETRLFAVALNWRTSKRWSTFLRYRFREQINEGDDPRLEDFDKHVVSLGFRYQYDLDLL
jgi:hypothetical protein